MKLQNILIYLTYLHQNLMLKQLKLGNKIRQWIKDGKPNPGESKVISSDEKEEIHKQDKEEEPKKKRGLFGRFKK